PDEYLDEAYKSILEIKNKIPTAPENSELKVDVIKPTELSPLVNVSDINKEFKHEDLFVYHIWMSGLTNAPFDNDYSVQAHKLSEVAKWIPHISALGANAVLLSPVLKAKTHGYDVTDYFQIDNRYGTNDEFKELVNEFHKNGIRVILDSVFNHCGRDFVKFKELQEGDRSKAKWFAGVDFSQGSPMGDYFTYQNWSGHYSLVKFNLYDEEVKNYLFDAAKFWINEFGIDGMRLDSANVIDLDFQKQLRSVCTNLKPNFWLMGEVVSGDYPRWVNGDTLHSVTNYMLYKALWSSHNDNNLYELASTIGNGKPDLGKPLCTFLDNHDQPRIASIVGRREYLPTLYALLFTLPGIPSVYYGSEWELKGVKEHGSDAPLRPYIDIENHPADTEITVLIQKLANIRANNKALRYGDYRQLYLQYHMPLAFERNFDGERIVVAINSQDCTHTISVGGESGKDLISGETVNLNNLTLNPFSAKIISFA
ncbi:MAG: hypothetical protein LBL93_04500, partial [Ruminococcus sp.]|nr:hypothetical protein [Ruminococcus sp.]